MFQCLEGPTSFSLAQSASVDFSSNRSQIILDDSSSLRFNLDALSLDARCSSNYDITATSLQVLFKVQK